MGDIDVDFCLETLKQLITNSELRFIIDAKHQLQLLEKEIEYLREFLKVTEKKRNEHTEVMNLERNLVQFLDDHVNKLIKTLTAEVKQMYDKNMYDDINGKTVKKFKHSFTGSSGSAPHLSHVHHRPPPPIVSNLC